MKERDLVVKYINSMSIMKLIRRNQKTNRLFRFLPERSDENLISISQAKTINGKPMTIAISDNLERISGERRGARNDLTATWPQIP